MSYVFLSLSIVSNVLGQLLMKYAADRINFDSSAGTVLIKHMLSSPFVIIGAGFYFLGMVAWLITLSKLELSFAYPFMAISYILVTFASFVLFKEPITTMKIAGILLIFIGVVVLGLSVGQRS